MDQASVRDEDCLVHWAESGEVWDTLGFWAKSKSLNWLLCRIGLVVDDLMDCIQASCLD